MSDDILSFEQHHRRQGEDGSLVRCGKMILATARPCPRCGVHFQGEAQDYLHRSEWPAGGRAGWVVVLGVVLVAAAVVSALALR